MGGESEQGRPGNVLFGEEKETGKGEEGVECREIMKSET